jgi:hypothetical protein
MHGERGEERLRAPANLNINATEVCVLPVDRASGDSVIQTTVSANFYSVSAATNSYRSDAIVHSAKHGVLVGEVVGWHCPARSSYDPGGVGLIESISHLGS